MVDRCRQDSFCAKWSFDLHRALLQYLVVHHCNDNLIMENENFGKLVTRHVRERLGGMLIYARSGAVVRCGYMRVPQARFDRRPRFKANRQVYFCSAMASKLMSHLKHEGNASIIARI